ncbi:MAG: hypothetical protein RSC30_07325, partial [Oscillospiraceae bacterium]
INDILSSLSPEDIASIKSMADSILGGSSGNGNQDENSNNSSGSPFGNSEGSDNPFASIDPAMIAKIGSLMGKLNAKKDDDRIRLLQALKPMLSDKRKTKTDEAIKFMGLFELLPELKNLNIF